MCFLEARSGSYPAFSKSARTFSLLYLSTHWSRISAGTFDCPFEFNVMTRLRRLSMALWESSGGGVGKRSSSKPCCAESKGSGSSSTPSIVAACANSPLRSLASLSAPPRGFIRKRGPVIPVMRVNYKPKYIYIYVWEHPKSILSPFSAPESNLDESVDGQKNCSLLWTN